MDEPPEQPVIGRDREIAAIEAALARVRNGDGALLDDAVEIAAALHERGLEPERLAEAERVGIVMLAPGRIGFTHPLYRSAAYHGAPPDDRRAAHRALADVLRGGGDRARRALHLAEATVTPDEEIAAELAAAAAELTSRGAHPQAGMFLERSALLSPHPEERADRLVLASAAVRERGNGARAAALAEAAAADAPSPQSRAEANAALGRALMLTGPMDRASALLGSAGEVIAGDDPLEAARWLIDAADAAYSAGDDRGGRRLARRASRLLRSTAEPERFAALAWIAFARVAAGDVRRVGQVIRLVTENRDATTGDERVAAATATLLLFADRYREAAEYCELVAARARSEGRLTLLVDSLRNLTQAQLRLGRFTEAAATGTDALLLAEGTGQSVQLSGILLDLGECAAWRGDEARLDECASRGLELARELDIRTLISSFERLRGLLAMGLGRMQEAVEHFEHTLADDIAQHPDRLHSSRAELAEALFRLGDASSARRHLDLFAEQAAGAELPSGLSVEARCRGLLAAGGDFDGHFRHAIELHPLFEDEGVKARNLLAYGMVLRRARRQADARAELRLAAEAFQRCGAWAWVRQAGSELRAAGGAAFQPRPMAGEALTPQEFQVAQAVAAGATNREVAAALFLSVKTVEAHLSRIYRKLGISSRRSLARQLEDATGDDQLV